MIHLLRDLMTVNVIQKTLVLKLDQVIERMYKYTEIKFHGLP